MIICKLLILISLLVKTYNSNCPEYEQCSEFSERIKRNTGTINDKTFQQQTVYNDGATEISTSVWPR